MKKTCFKCGEEKPRDDFYKHKGMADGILNKCKPCTKKDTALNWRNNKEYYREYDRIRAHDPKRKSMHKRWLSTDRAKQLIAKRKKEWNIKNHHIRTVHSKFWNAIKRGEIVKQDCEICGGRAQAHHEDYTKPLEVRWLCPQHHSDAHRGWV